MRGKKFFKKDNLEPDARYNRLDVAKFINYKIKRKKKSVERKIVYDVFELIKEKTKKDPIQTWEKALKNVGPSVEIRGRRVGGANYQVPFPVKDKRRFTLAIRWIIAAAKQIKGKSMAEKLAQILIDSAKGEGSAVKKKQDVHRMAQANRAFAHFAKFG